MMKMLFGALLKTLFRVEMKGSPETFRNSRTLIVANHESFIDGLLLHLSMPVDAVFVVHTQVTSRPLLRFLLRFVPHLAVDSASPLAMKQIVKLVETGRPVVIFPEGRITKTGSLMKVYDGAAFVAAKTGATIVPVRIDGAARSYFGRLAGVYPRKLFPKVTISIQPRRSIPMPELPSAKQRRRRAGQLLRQILLDMLVATRPQRTLFEAFLEGKTVFGAQYKLVEDIRLVEESYGSLLKMSLGIQRLMSRLTAPGDLVGLLTPNAAPTLGLVLALSAGKRVPAMLNYTAGPEGVRAACTAARIKTIIASRTFLEKARLTHLVEQLPGITVHFLEDLKLEFGFRDKLWVLWHLTFPKGASVPQRPDDPAIVLFTSGSEGKPKGVVHSHNSVLSNVAQVRAVADFTPLDKFMLALPLFHSFGLTCGLLLPLVSGCKVFLYPSPLHYRIIPELVYDRDCTVLFGTSTFLGNYGKFAHPYDFGRLRYVVAGAEKLSDDVRKLWIDKFGIRILEGYGVTECAPVVAVNVPMACRIGSVGQLLPGITYELEAVPGIEEGGVLHVKGPNVMKGYLLFDRPGVIQPPKSVGEGWYGTGDIVAIDDDGFLHIRGRMKRFAKIAGEMVSLEVVEKIAATAVSDCAHAASTRDDPGKGEALVLFSTAPKLTREQLIVAARSLGLPELAVPRTICCIEAIPLLGSGKTDYVTLKRMAEENGLTAGGESIMSSQFSLLKERRFGPFFWTQFLGAFNDNLFKNALVVILTFHATQWTALKPELLANLAAGVFILPFFLFSATAGQLADKYDKALLARLVKVLEIGIMLVAGLGFWVHSLAVLMGCLFLFGLHSTLFGPVKYAILPQHLLDKELVGGNALVEAGTFVAILLGTLLGGLLAGLEGSTTWITAACLFLAGAGYLCSRGVPPAGAPEPALRVNPNPITETWRNIGFARENRTVFLSILGVSWFWLYGALLLAQFPAYAKNVLGGTETSVTLLLATFTLGIGIGSLLCERLSSKQVEIGLVPFGSIGLTVFGLALAFASPAAPPAAPLPIVPLLAAKGTLPVLLDLFAIGLFGGFFIVPLYALLQLRSSPAHRARIIAANNIMNALFMVVGTTAAAGLLGAGLSIPALFGVAALCNAAVAAYIYGLVPEFLLRFVIWLLVHSVYKLEKRGVDRIPEDGPALIISNHVSYVDALIIAAACRRPIRFLLDHRFFRWPVLSYALRTGRAIPIPTGSENAALREKAFAEAAEALVAGELVSVFPEGGITDDGALGPFRTGIERILERSPVPVVPIAISGLWGSIFSRCGGTPLRRPWKARPFRPLTITVGEPVASAAATLEGLHDCVLALRGLQK